MMTIKLRLNWGRCRKLSYQSADPAEKVFAIIAVLACALLTIGAFTGCKPKPPAEDVQSPQPPFQTESQFIVHEIVTDLAEQISYAASGRFPDAQVATVNVVEKTASPMEAPVYECQVLLNTDTQAIRADILFRDAIWSPAPYQALVAELAKVGGLTPVQKAPPEEKGLLTKLADLNPATIEEENQRVSTGLEKDFRNPELHEQAAVLLGAFCLREHSGRFFEIRSPLCRMTAHLAMASLLRGSDSLGINGRMAEAMLLTLVHNSGPAIQRLKAFDSQDPAVVPLVRALQVRNTGDYRILAERNGLSGIESLCWFQAQASYAGTASAWERLSRQNKAQIDFIRAANEQSYSVEMGHILSRAALSLELEEAETIYRLSQGKKLARRELMAALNQVPERCISIGRNNTPRVRVIGWGQWAAFLQRHLCHAVQQQHRFLDGMWGVHDAAREFATEAGEHFGMLRLYPFVARMIASDETAYRQALDAAARVAIETPHLVSADCWNWFVSKPKYAAMYRPLPASRVSEWHRPILPPGTCYNIGPRMSQSSFAEGPHGVAFLEKLHELAPYDCRICGWIIEKKYNQQPTYDQAAALYKEVLPYSVTAIRAVAFTVHDNPVEYEKLMLRAAEVDPRCFYDLFCHAEVHVSEDKASEYLEKACAVDPDAVRVSNHALWRVKYFLKKGEKDKAREIADESADVYSSIGLEAKALFLERTGRPDEAFEWYLKKERRYDSPSALIAFCMRYQNQTGDRRYESEIKRRVGKVFPNGIEKAILADFSGSPVDGVLIVQENDLVKAAGLHAGDIIVAVYGIRVHDFRQYEYGRELEDDPILNLIVWQGNSYREVKANVPGHKFGVPFRSYVRQ